MVPPYGVGSVRVVDVNEELKFVEHYEGPVVMIVINDWGDVNGKNWNNSIFYKSVIFQQ